MMFNRLQRHFDSFICNRNTIFPQVPTMVLFAYCDVISWSIFFSISPQQQQNRLLIKTTKSTKLRTTLSLSLNLSDSCQPASVFASRQHVLSLHFATNITQFNKFIPFTQHNMAEESLSERMNAFMDLPQQGADGRRSVFIGLITVLQKFNIKIHI